MADPHIECARRSIIDLANVVPHGHHVGFSLIGHEFRRILKAPDETIQGVRLSALLRLSIALDEFVNAHRAALIALEVEEP